MHLLDDLKKIKQLDQADVLNSIGFFPDQYLQALSDVEKLTLPKLSGKINNIIVSGMGGSAFACEIVKILFASEIKVPVEIIKDYQLPAYVNHKTLVVCASYSGTTSETLSAALQAVNKKATVLCLSVGGQLKKLALKHRLRGYFFVEKYNPCHQPRVGTGYLFGGFLGLLIKTGLIDLRFEQVETKVKQSQKIKKYCVKVPFKENTAKQMAVKLKNKFVLLCCSEFLDGIIHAFANQLNETAKANSAFHYLPEMNHHRMEGLKFPIEFNKSAVFIFYPSKLYDKRNTARYPITYDVMKKNNYQILKFESFKTDKISQALEVFIFNAYVSFYLAVLHQVDPSKIPWVDYFKNELKKRNL